MAVKLKMKKIGQKLHVLRQKRGLTMTELADILGVRHAHISRIESGLKRPSSDLILKIADVFGVTADQLMRDELELE